LARISPQISDERPKVAFVKEPTATQCGSRKRSESHLQSGMTQQPTSSPPRTFLPIPEGCQLQTRARI